MTDRLKIAAIGSWGSVAGFGPQGLDVFVVENAQDARSVWADDIAGAPYAIVLVTERVYAQISDLAEALQDGPTPAVTVIPDAGDSGGVGKEKIRNAMERALGISVPSGEEDR